jgi:hypothetical protein
MIARYRRTLVFTLSSAYVLLGVQVNVARADDLVRIELSQPSLPFHKVTISEEIGNNLLNLSMDDQGKAAGKYPHSADDFYTFHTFRFDIDRDISTTWPMDLRDIGFTISVMIRRDEQPFDMLIPVDLPQRADGDALTKLERNVDRTKAPGKLVQSAILALHFQSAFGDQSDVTRRAVRIWFDTEYMLATNFGSHFAMTDDLRQALQISFKGKPDILKDLLRKADDANSKRLEDLYGRFDDLVARKECDLARALIGELGKLSTDSPSVSALRSVKQENIDGKYKQLENYC